MRAAGDCAAGQALKERGPVRERPVRTGLGGPRGGAAIVARCGVACQAVEARARLRLGSGRGLQGRRHKLS